MHSRATDRGSTTDEYSKMLQRLPCCHVNSATTPVQADVSFRACADKSPLVLSYRYSLLPVFWKVECFRRNRESKAAPGLFAFLLISQSSYKMCFATPHVPTRYVRVYCQLTWTSTWKRGTKRSSTTCTRHCPRRSRTSKTSR